MAASLSEALSSLPFLGVAASIATSSALYTQIWLAPGAFARFVAPRDPVRTMMLVSTLLKVVQLSGVAALELGGLGGGLGGGALGGGSLGSSLGAARAWLVGARASYEASPALAACALAACALGQFMNFSVYRALGSTGVYYGVRFGRAVPWVHGWPFEIAGVPLRDPQYWGAILTAVGLSFFAREPLARSALAFWVANYFFLMWVESFSVETKAPAGATTAGASASAEAPQSPPPRRGGVSGDGAKKGAAPRPSPARKASR